MSIFLNKLISRIYTKNQSIVGTVVPDRQEASTLTRRSSMKTMYRSVQTAGNSCVVDPVQAPTQLSLS